MKKVILFLLMGLIMACSNDDHDFVVPVSHGIKVTFNEGYDHAPAAGVQLVLINSDDGKTYELTTDSHGMAEVEVVPGKYNVNASLVYSPAEYASQWGQVVTGPVSFNASKNEVLINGSSTGLVELVLVSGKIGNILIKQIYYSGSDTKLGASFRDQFFELYNNSNETVFLDGLCFAQVHGAASVSANLKSYHLPNGQYDWGQSYNQQDVAKANTDYIYADEVIRFPGSGQEFALEPRKSVIVAATAVNHKKPLSAVNPKGEQVVYEVPEPERTIDLSNAPFEAYFRPYQESIGATFLASDIDNPNSVNMDIVFKTFAGNDLILDPLGRDAFAIFYADDELINQWNSVPLPSITSEKFTESTNVYLQVPIDVILDGVEVQHTDPSKGKPKRLPDAVDAGEISTLQGAYSSESVIRKRKEVNGIFIYQDTNNSSKDFEVLSHPEVIIE